MEVELGKKQLASSLIPSLPCSVPSHTGGRTAPEIVNWLNKRTGPPAQDLTTPEQALDFSKKDEVVVIGFFQNTESEAAIAYISTAEAHDSVSFGITTSKEVADSLDATLDSIVLFKQVCVLHELGGDLCFGEGVIWSVCTCETCGHV